MTELVNAIADGWIPSALRGPVARTIEILLIFCFGLVLTWVVRGLFRRIYAAVHRMNEHLESMTADDARRINTLLGAVQTLVILLLWGVAIVMMLGQAGVNIGPILAGAGIVGVALGFGAQHLVRDLISGFFIILENHVRLGDVAKINGIGGLVERITYRVIVLRDLEGAVHVFSHGSITTLTNLTKDFSYAVVDIGVAYKEGPDRVMEVLCAEATRMAMDPVWAAAGVTGAEMLGVEAFESSALMIRLRIKTAPMQQWSVKREFLRRVKLAFDREGIEIPFPQRSLIYGAGQDPLPVRIEQVHEKPSS